jgi:hypothetical protein
VAHKRRVQPLSKQRAHRPGAHFLRLHSEKQRATDVELFFDLVYVFAVTQLSHRLLDHATVRGALETLLLFAMVWLVWPSCGERSRLPAGPLSLFSGCSGCWPGASRPSSWPDARPKC